VRDDVRKVVGHEVAMTLGVYAATDRWELFAEALTYAYISRDPVLRARLARCVRSCASWVSDASHAAPSRNPTRASYLLAATVMQQS